MKINIDEELEKAHETYEEYKKGILSDLLVLNTALYDLTLIEAVITPDHFEEFRKIIGRTYKFIQKGEI